MHYARCTGDDDGLTKVLKRRYPPNRTIDRISSFARNFGISEGISHAEGITGLNMVRLEGSNINTINFINNNIIDIPQQYYDTLNYLMHINVSLDANSWNIQYNYHNPEGDWGYNIGVQHNRDSSYSISGSFSILIH